MRRLLVALTLAVACYSSQAQYNYNDISDWGRKAIFMDEFNDNSNNWWLYNNEYFTIGKIERGYYYAQALDTVPKLIRHEIPIPANIDFEIETKMTLTKNITNHVNGLVWGYQNTDNFYVFGYSANGFYEIQKIVNNEWKDIVAWTESPLVKGKGENKLTIRRIDNVFYFYFNETLVHSMPAEPFFGDYMGFRFAQQATLLVDYWNVTELIVPLPKISWLSPSNNETTDRSDYNVKAKITSQKAITNLLMFVNDFPIPASKDDLVKIDKDYYFQKKVSLNDGQNAVILKVSNGNDMVTSKPAYIALGGTTNQYRPQQPTNNYMATQTTPVTTQPSAIVKSDIDVDIPVNATNPRRFALVIGNEDYSSFQKNLGSESNVAFAVNDATAFKEYAQKVLGLEERNIFFLTNATAGAMNQKIELVTKIISKMNGMAELYFYYAGHGFPDEETRVPYLIPVDVNILNIDQGIKLSDLYQKLNSCGAKKVTVVLDACFSGGGREGGLIAARGVKVKPKEDVAIGNLVVFTASTGEQSSLPYAEKGHGMFTYYFLKKLKDSKGKVTYKDMFDYLKENVSIESLRTNYKEQDPQLNTSPSLQKTWEGWMFNP